MTEKADEFLAHFGIKGMKWGVRRGNKSPRPVSADHSVSRQLKKKRLDEMSNAELQQLVTRMNLEQQYSKLNLSPKSDTQKFVENLAKQQLSSFVSKQGPMLIEKALKAYAG